MNNDSESESTGRKTLNHHQDKLLSRELLDSRLSADVSA